MKIRKRTRRRTTRRMINTRIMYLEIALISISIFIGIFVTISIYAEHTGNHSIILPIQPQQKGGIVTLNEFPITHYTNETDRKLTLHIHLETTKEEIIDIDLNGLKEFTIFTVGNKFWDKQIIPLRALENNRTYTVPLNDGIKDSYRSCFWFGNYDRQSECIGINTYKNITSGVIDVSHELDVVYKDVLDENGVDPSSYS